MEEFELLKNFPEKVGKVFDEKPELICPITQELFVEPVFVDGYTFEKTAILTWFQKSQLNPITKNPVPHDQRRAGNLKINYDKKSTVAAYKSKVMRKVHKYIEEYFGKMSMTDGVERENIIKLIEKFIERGKEMDPKNSNLLVDAMKYYDTLMKVSPNRIRVYQRKRDVHFKNYIESLVEKKSYDPALEAISKERNFKESPELLEKYIGILKLSGPENDPKVLEYSLVLVNLWIGKRRFKNAMTILTDKSFKHTIQTLLLLKHTVLPNIKPKKGEPLRMPTHLVRELSQLYFQGGRYEDSLIEILSLPSTQPSERNLKIQELIEIKRQLASLRTEGTKKHVSKTCEELANLYMTDPSQASQNRALTILREGHLADPASLTLLKKVYDLTYGYMNNHLKDKLQTYATQLNRNSGDINRLKRDNTRLRVDNKRLVSQNDDLRRIIKQQRILHAQHLNNMSSSTNKPKPVEEKLPPKVPAFESSPDQSVSQITSVNRTNSYVNKSGKGIVIWSNYICDECRCQPVIGPRYESADDGEDYDLCEECYLAGKGGEGRSFKVFLSKEGEGKMAGVGLNAKKDEEGFNADEKLKKLREMGFHADQRMLKSLISKYKGDLIVIVKHLLQLKKK